MGRGVFKRVIRGRGAAQNEQPLAAQAGIEKKTARAQDLAQAAENGTATTNAGSPLGTDGSLSLPTAQTDADSGRLEVPRGDDSCPSASLERHQSVPDRQDATGHSGDIRERPESQGLKKAPVIYGDVEVCRLLKIRRRKIAEARTKATRGVDWDCVGLHAGMTMKWIEETAIKQGIVPDFFNAPLHPIQENDGVVSCKLIGTWPNRKKVTVEVVATGEAKVATVRDAYEFHLYDIFDARDYGREIEWVAELNGAVY